MNHELLMLLWGAVYSYMVCSRTPKSGYMLEDFYGRFQVEHRGRTGTRPERHPFLRYCLFPCDVQPKFSLKVFRQISPFIKENKRVHSVLIRSLDSFTFHRMILQDLVVLQKLYMTQGFWK